MAKSLQHHIVARALELISDEAHWTRVVIARTADGKPCCCLDPAAKRFCAIGALYRAAGELLGVDGLTHAYRAQKYVLTANNHFGDGLAFINDNEGHRAIVAMFKVALAQ